MNMKKILTSLLATSLFHFTLLAGAPKYIFLMFGDGMSLNSIALTENYDSYLEGDPYGARFLNFRNFPYVGLCDCRSAASYVSGSSEAATALFCGHKARTNQVGMTPEGRPVESIFSKLHTKGYKVGILSTDPIDHATPSVAYSHVNYRGKFRDIVLQLPRSGFEFFAGESFAGFENVLGDMNADEYLASEGYTTYYGLAEFAAGCAVAKDKKNWGRTILVPERCRRNRTSITAEVDQTKDYSLEETEGDLTPVQMLDCCLGSFGTGKPFIILCEEGGIDHAAHLNCPMALVSKVHSLENAVGRALEFYRKHPKETLIVVFSDHETGGLILGKRVKDGLSIDWQPMIDEWNSDKPKSSYKMEECRALSDRCNVVWTSKTHTGGPTPVFAIGAGAEKFGCCMDNVDFFRILSRITRLER